VGESERASSEVGEIRGGGKKTGMRRGPTSRADAPNSKKKKKRASLTAICGIRGAAKSEYGARPGTRKSWGVGRCKKKAPWEH